MKKLIDDIRTLCKSEFEKGKLNSTLFRKTIDLCDAVELFPLQMTNCPENDRNNITPDQKINELTKAALPLHEFMCKYYNPHSTAIVTIGSAEVLQGDCATTFPVPD